MAAITDGSPESAAQTAAQLALGSTPELFAPQRMTTRARWFRDAADERLVAVMDPGAGLAAADEVLAYGLAWQGDRDLLLVLPESLVSTTLVRLPWIGTEVRVWNWDGTPSLHPVPLPTRLGVLGVMGEYPPRRTGQHLLTPEQHEWIAGIDTGALTERHRPSYLAWHLDGLQVLKVARARGGRLRVQAGVQYSKPVPGRDVFDAVIAGPLTPEQRATIQDRIDDAIADGGSRTSQMREHRLQHHFDRDGGGVLGLDVLLREYPGYRGPGLADPGTSGPGRRGFIDFLGMDGAGRLHVVETKIGHDPTVLLQALDYAIWVEANQRAVVATSTRLSGAARTSPVPIHLVLAPGDGQPAFNTYLAGQIEALAGDIPVRVHLVPDLKDPLAIQPLTREDMWTAQDGLVAAPATGRRWPGRITDGLIQGRA